MAFDSLTRLGALSALCLLALGCRADVWIEGPDERALARADTVGRTTRAALIDTVFRPMPVDSAAASFAWLIDRPKPRLPSSRAFPRDPVAAVRQYLRALSQTGSSSRGVIGVGEIGYERAFTYLHPRVRRSMSTEELARRLGGVVRPTIVRLRAVPGDSTLVFAELLVLREVDEQAMLGLYYGHFAARSGDNGWQLTGARLASEDWQSRLGRIDEWRYDRARAANEFATEDVRYTRDLVELESGEWVPLARPAPAADLMLGLPELR